MSLELPLPIAAFVEANAQLDVDGMLKPFAADAVAYDMGKSHQGHAELRRWFEEEVIAVKAISRRTPSATKMVKSSSTGRPMAISPAARSDSAIASRSRTAPSKPWTSRHDHKA